MHSQQTACVYLYVQQENVVSCDVTEEINSTTVVVDCSVTSLLLPAQAQVNLSQSHTSICNHASCSVRLHLNTNGALG